MGSFDLENWVVQANELVGLQHDMNNVHLKIFKMAISCIDVEHPNTDITMRKKDIYDFFGARDTNAPARFKQQLVNFHKKAFLVFNSVNSRGRKVQDSFPIFTHVHVEDDNDVVQFFFNDRLMPYLVELRANFTQYKIYNIKMDSSYSIRIYELVKMLKGKSMGRYNSQIFSLEDIKKLLNCEKKYSDVRNFEKKVLQVAKKEINEKTDLKMSYEKIKNGRSIKAIKFTWGDKKAWKSVGLQSLGIKVPSSIEEILIQSSIFEEELEQLRAELDARLGNSNEN